MVLSEYEQSPLADKPTSLAVRQLRDTLDDERWNSVLFNDSFQRSRLYFTVLETLRVSSSWVVDMMEDWDSLREQWAREVRPSEIFDEADWRAAEIGWDAVTRTVQAKAKLLKDRMDRKSEEVKSLRDGVWITCHSPSLSPCV